jgi:NitT/TauT family transport system substrate-binding protein
VRILHQRRDVLTTLGMLGALGGFGAGDARADDGPPETTVLRLPYDPSICLAPIFIADALLEAEGFTRIERVAYPAYSPDESVLRGDVDFDTQNSVWAALKIAAGEPVTVIGGVHAGCYELFAEPSIDKVSDLRGRRVGVQTVGSSGHFFLALMAANVGLDPDRDITWVESPTLNLLDRLEAGEIDAFLAYPPEPQALRARGIGRSILSITTDRPWSQYICCMAVANRSFVERHPIATKRFLRATLKAADLCKSEPATVARTLVTAGYATDYDHAFEALVELPFRAWRDFDSEDSLRFYANRLHEAGLLTMSPQTVLATGADWRFFDEIRRELRA